MMKRASPSASELLAAAGRSRPAAGERQRVKGERARTACRGRAPKPPEDSVAPSEPLIPAGIWSHRCTIRQLKLFTREKLSVQYLVMSN
jgi:hypothetical protein